MQRITYICDECGEEFDCDEGLQLKEAWEQAKAEGWFCYCDGGTWIHKCEGCR